jgi:hypothetical protein
LTEWAALSKADGVSFRLGGPCARHRVAGKPAFGKCGTMQAPANQVRCLRAGAPCAGLAPNTMALAAR